MGRHTYGFYTGDLAIPPYLSQNEVLLDCEGGLIPNLWRRPSGTHTKWIIHKDEVEPYYQSKGLPDFIIEKKLRELKIVTPLLLVKSPKPATEQLNFIS